MGSSHGGDRGDRVTSPTPAPPHWVTGHDGWPSQVPSVAHMLKLRFLLGRSVASSSVSPAWTPAKTHGSG